MNESRNEEKLSCVVRGYDVYKWIWEPCIVDCFTTKHEKNNAHDKYAIAVLPVNEEKIVVGHLSKEISKECCHSVLHDGSIVGEVTDRRCRTLEAYGGMGYHVN